MKCPECGKDNPEGTAFCGCGYDFSSDSIMNTLDEEPPEEEKKQKKRRQTKKKAKKARDDADNKKKSRLKLKIILAVAAAVIIAAAILVLLILFSSTEGEKVLKNVPIGRDIAYAETKINRSFTTVSKYSALNSLCDFDNVCESESGLRVEGNHFPEWAVTVSLAEDNTISRVAYYDFSVLQKSWKGHRSSGELDSGFIEYGMSEKAVERKMGFKPYTIAKEIDNTVTFVYRYYYSDDVTGNDVVCNYYVVFNDVDESVKNVYSSEIDYRGLMLGTD